MSRVVTAVLAIILLAACSSDPGDDRASTVEPTPESTTIDDEVADEEDDEPATVDREAAELLLTLADMPSGWTTADDLTDESTGEPMCDDAEGDRPEADDEASADFSGGDFGPHAAHRVAVFSDEDTAQEAVDSIMAELEACRSYTDEDGDERTVQPLSFDRYGDDTFAYRERVEGDDVEVVFDVVVVRSGAALSVVAVAEAFTTPDTDLVTAVVESAVAKL